jgi:hypothetical protein
MAISPLTFFWLDDPHDLQCMLTPNRSPGPTLAKHSLRSGLTRFACSLPMRGGGSSESTQTGMAEPPERLFPCHDSGAAHARPLLS